MGIIGVVAALTIPNLNASTGEAEKVAKVKKNYAQLNEALGRAVAKYGPIGTWFVNDGDDYDKMSKRFGERMTEFLKVSKVCGTTGTGCFSNKPYFSNSTLKFSDIYEEYYKNYEEELISNKFYRVVLADGTSVGFFSDWDMITVDIDGPNKGKNTEGIDIFRFGIYENTLMAREEAYLINYDASIIDYNNGIYLSPVLWVLQNGNLDYLKCPDSLAWGTKTSCK